MKLFKLALAAGACVAALAGAGSAMASSHREAPFITKIPKMDGTDFYMFRSYEDGKSGFVTILANYQPLQDTYGGPNYFQMDPNGVYEIHIDNNGDAVEDITYQFRFRSVTKNLSLSIAGSQIPIPLINAGQIGVGGNPTGTDALNVLESYTVGVINGPRRASRPVLATNPSANNTTAFPKPVDYIGTKSLPAYAQYALAHVQPIVLPGCSTQGRVFVGQRQEAFAINLGQVFDLINTSILSFDSNGNLVSTPFIPADEALADAGPNKTDDKAVTTIALEVPISCLTKGDDPVIGGWTTSSLPRNQLLNPVVTRLNPSEVRGGDLVQVSRLGSPLVNEVVIGLPDKDRFNNSEPKNDLNDDRGANPGFGAYVTNPTLSTLIQVLFGPGSQALGGPNIPIVLAPQFAPRTDLIAAFITGVPMLNMPKNLTRGGEMLRLNTSSPVVAAAMQNRLGVLGSDGSGFPNGRRPGDDVTDIELRVVMGAVAAPPIAPNSRPSDSPAAMLPFVDGAIVTAADVDSSFPYLRTPIAGNLDP
jgi:Domain of unknown function (DUF4331)